MRMALAAGLAAGRATVSAHGFKPLPPFNTLPLAPSLVQRLKGEVDLENYENVPVPKPRQVLEDDY